jgi:hypothetical protein
VFRTFMHKPLQYRLDFYDARAMLDLGVVGVRETVRERPILRTCRDDVCARDGPGGSSMIPRKAE